MELYGYSFLREEDLMHHGIKGQKWGVRRYQNEDGSWTAAGRERYGDSDGDRGSRSVAGTARRALAKVYDINERYYSKRGNNAMASMNKTAKEQMLAKAQAADKAAAEKRAQKVENQKPKTTSADVYGKGRRTTAEQYNRRTKDQNRFGDDGYNRIKDKLDKGKSYKAAVRAEKGRKFAKRMATRAALDVAIDFAFNDGKATKNAAKVAYTAGVATKMAVNKKRAERAADKAAHTVWDADQQRFVYV